MAGVYIKLNVVKQWISTYCKNCERNVAARSMTSTHEPTGVSVSRWICPQCGRIEDV